MSQTTYSINDLKNVMKRLLSENGCPWDKEQTHTSLRKYLIEECYEAVEAINNKDMDNLCEELGDILFQIIFHSELAEKKGSFNLDNVINDVTAKMIYRHPHVFSDEKTDNKNEIIDTWDKLKEKEKGYKSSKDIIDSIPKALPALIRSQKVIAKSIKYNKYSPNIDTILTNISNYSNILKTANLGQKEELQEIIGNFLFELTKFSQILQINADFSLTNALETFITRIEDY